MPQGIVGYTIERAEIRRRAAARDARPIRRAGRDGPPVAFALGDASGPGDGLAWDAFFALMDEHELALVYRDEDAEGHLSTEFSFVPR
jgi:hypothetical protein